MGRKRNEWLQILRDAGTSEYRIRKIRETNRRYVETVSYHKIEEANEEYGLNEKTPELNYETVVNEIASGNEANATDVQKRYEKELDEFEETGETASIKAYINQTQSDLRDIGVRAGREDLKEILADEDLTNDLRALMSEYSFYEALGGSPRKMQEIRDDIEKFIKNKETPIFTSTLKNTSLYIEK